MRTCHNNIKQATGAPSGAPAAVGVSSKVERVPHEILFRSNPDGIMPEEQVEAVLWGFFYRVTQTRDRRGGSQQVGERPKRTRVWNEEENRWESEGGAPVYSSGSVNRHTGLPESAGSLVPNHRALYGWDLALKLILPPEDFMAACIYTDELPENVGVGEDKKEWRALCFKPKFKVGPTGRPLTWFFCRKCRFEWRGELPDTTYPCRRCRADGVGFEHGLDDSNPVVDTRVEDNWSDDEVRAVKTNTRTLKRVLSRLAGYFVLKPKIDEKDAELGTTVLYDPQDEEDVLGFKVTSDGLRYAEEWAKVHPEFARGHHLLEAMGPTFAEKAPQWIKHEYRSGLVPIEIAKWF